MPVIDTILDGVLVRRHDDDLRRYSEWDQDGLPVMVDIPYTDEQNAEADGRAAAFDEQFNEATLHDKIRTALAVNDAWLGRTTTPTNAQILQHIDRLTRENSALIRIVARVLNTVEGT